MTTKPDQSEVVLHASGGTTFAGKDSVNLFRAITLKAALNLYAKTGMIPTRGVSGSRLLAMATEYTGKHYKRGTHTQAAEDLRVWIETMKAALPITDNRKPAASNPGDALFDDALFQVDDNEPIDYRELVRVNSDDEALCEWARTAKVGDVFPAHVNCTRIA